MIIQNKHPIDCKQPSNKNPNTYPNALHIQPSNPNITKHTIHRKNNPIMSIFIVLMYINIEIIG